MNKNKKLLFVLLSILFLTAPLGIVAFSPTGSTTTTASAIPAAEYDFMSRREPISVLVYNEYSDNAGGGEYEYTMIALLSEYGYTMEYDNLTDHTQLESVIDDYDVLLLIEQEDSTFAQMDAVASEWNGFISGWVDDGGIVICMDHFSAVESDYHPTARILNGTGLMSIYNSTPRTGESVTITDSYDPLAFGVSAWTGPSGTSSFDTPDGNEVFGTGGQTVVAHRYFGFGHVVMLGFDMYSTDPNPTTVLANAVRLTRLAVFDNSHAQIYDPYSGYNTFATHIQENFGFAIATMNTWNPSMIESCEVLVAGNNYLTVIPFNTSEVDFVSDFVASGGGLLIFSEIWWYGNCTDPLLTRFGYERNQTAGYAADTDDNERLGAQPFYGPENIANHSATIGVSSVQMYGSTAFTTIPDDATPLIWADTDGTAGWNMSSIFSVDNSGYSLATSKHHGAGRIVTIADGSMFHDTDGDTDGGIDFFDLSNEEFASSVMVWLSAAGIPEKTVLFEQSHSPFFTLNGNMEAARLLSFNGFNIRWTSHFSAELINEASVIVNFEGSNNYTTPEKEVLYNFVANGGGLFMLCDHTSYNVQTNDIISEFGMVVDDTSYLIDEDDGWVDSFPNGSYVAYDFDSMSLHPIMNGVRRIEIDRGCGFASIGSGTALVTTDTDGTSFWYTGAAASGVPVIAATSYNLGRVVVLPDLNFFSNGDSDTDDYEHLYDSDNDVFIVNAFYWLIENRAPVVEVVFPNGGELLNATQYIEWTAVDPNGDEMSFDVYLSDNNGSDWSLLTSGLTVLQYEWNTTLHDDGNSYMILVEASDGVLSGQDTSDNPFELDNFAGGPIPGLPLDPTLLLIIAGAVVVVIVILVLVMKRKK